MTIGFLEKLKMKMSPLVIQTYQNKSPLSLFAAVSEEIPEGITLKDWYINYMKSIPKAAAGSGGNFAGNKVTFDANHFKLSPVQASLYVEMGKVERMMFEKSGMLPLGVEQMANSVAITAGKQLINGLDGDGNQAPLYGLFGAATVAGKQYNFIRDNANAGTGTIDRMQMAGTSAGGKWNLASNAGAKVAQANIYSLKQQLVNKGFNPATSIVIIPRCASAVFTMAWNDYKDKTPADMIADAGFMGYAELEDEYLPTAADATPTTTAFDIYAVDMAMMKIGYTQTEVTRYKYDAYNDMTKVELEVQFCPAFYPRNISDVIFKGVSQITAINAVATS